MNVVWRVDEVGLVADLGRRGAKQLHAVVFRDVRSKRWCGIIDSDVGGWEQRQGFWRTRGAAVDAVESALRGDRAGRAP